MKSILTILLTTALLVGCKSPPGPLDTPEVDPQIAQFTSSAKAAYAAGAIERAARFYEQALDRARVINDSSEIGRNAYNAAACLIILGQFQKVPALLREAQSEFQARDIDTTPVLLLEAKAARLQGKQKEAEAIVETIAKDAKEPADRFQAYLIQAEIACDQNKLDDAQKAAKRAARLESEISGEALPAALAGVEGKIFLLQKDFEKAASRFDREAEGWREAARYREMALALRRAGEAYLKGENPNNAADRLYRAARSLFAQGNTVESLKVIELAIQAADQAEDENIAWQITALFEEIQKTTRNSKQVAAQ